MDSKGIARAYIATMFEKTRALGEAYSWSGNNIYYKGPSSLLRELGLGMVRSKLTVRSKGMTADMSVLLWVI